jgi:cobalt-precorrin 5A hydrolase
LEKIFNSYDCLIGVMATGIMVRNICNLIKNKSIDPAVLVMDEKGSHVISLLSGHLGGGNVFSFKIAQIIGAEPVITTATDLNCKFGVDSLARKYLLTVTEPSKIKIINSALLKDETVGIAFNTKFEFIWDDNNVQSSYVKVSNQSDSVSIIKDSLILNLMPRKVVVGLGSKRDIDYSAVINAVTSAMYELDLPVKRIDSIATGQMKQKEGGINYTASEMGVPLEIIPEDVLKDFKHPDLKVSDFVMEKFGVPGVCEPSALIAAGANSTLIYRKTIINGVTVAVAVSNPNY